MNLFRRHILHRLFTGWRCIEHMDGYFGWKYGSVCDNDFDQYDSCVWYDAAVDIYAGKSDIRSGRFGGSLFQFGAVRCSLSHTIGSRIINSAISTTSVQNIGSNSEATVDSVDSIHCDICHCDQPVFVRIVFVAGEFIFAFRLFEWAIQFNAFFSQIIIAGLGLPWIGYVAGYLAAGLFGQNHKDRLAIGLETGIQNTGISIFLLRLSLPQPAADLTTVVPVSVAIMTPVPLLIYYIVLKIHQW